MSHISTILTKLVSVQHIVKALEDMGILKVAVPNDDEIVVLPDNTGYPKGDFRFSRMADGRFKAQITDFDRGRFNRLWFQKLTQRYAYHVALETFKAQNFEMIEETAERDGTIHLTLRRMAG